MSSWWWLSHEPMSDIFTNQYLANGQDSIVVSCRPDDDFKCNVQINCRLFAVSYCIVWWWVMSHTWRIHKSTIKYREATLWGPFKLYDSFAEYSLFYWALEQKRPMILRSLLIEATPYRIVACLTQLSFKCVTQDLHMCDLTHSYVVHRKWTRIIGQDDVTKWIEYHACSYSYSRTSRIVTNQCSTYSPTNI